MYCVCHYRGNKLDRIHMNSVFYTFCMAPLSLWSLVSLSMKWAPWSAMMLWAWECTQGVLGQFRLWLICQYITLLTTHMHGMYSLRLVCPFLAGSLQWVIMMWPKPATASQCWHFNTRKICFKRTWLVFTCLCIRVQRFKKKSCWRLFQVQSCFFTLWKSSLMDGLGLCIPDKSETEIRKKVILGK